MTLLSHHTRTGFVALEWKPADCWIGAFFRHRMVQESDRLTYGEWHRERRRYHQWEVWICLLPMLPVHVRWVRGVRV